MEERYGKGIVKINDNVENITKEKLHYNNNDKCVDSFGRKIKGYCEFLIV